jgi:dTDP-4-dehydrorhamnose reductase
MKILLLGKNGQVGWELQRALAPLGEVIALDRNDTPYSGDLSDLDRLRATVRAISPDVIVNAAAYTAVDKAEADRVLAARVNAEAPALLAQEAARLGALLVHYSTDYVFDGSGQRPWTEADSVGPVNFYGETKLAGEQAIKAAGCLHVIFRTSWVYGARGSNFAKTILRLAADRPSLNVIDDQVGAPTGAELLADVTAQVIPRLIAKPQLSGTYHLAASGETSWHAYATLVIASARNKGMPLAVHTILPIPSSSYPTAAARPLNSRLDTKKITESFSIFLPSWENGVLRMLAEIIEE